MRAVQVCVLGQGNHDGFAPDLMENRNTRGKAGLGAIEPPPSLSWDHGDTWCGEHSIQGPRLLILVFRILVLYLDLNKVCLNIVLRW